MRKKNTFLKIVLILLAAAAIGTGCFFLGRDLGGKNAEKAFQAERDLNILLSRSELEGLGEIEGQICVTGHKSPDSDTVGCSVAYADLLRKLGYDAKAYVLGDINNESAYILEKAGVEVPPLLTDASGQNLVLVDHSEFLQSADGLESADIISIIDHHGDGSVTTSKPLIYDARPLGAAGTIVWLRYRHYGVEVDPKIAYVMTGSILSDTNNLKSTSVTAADREAVKYLSTLAGITDTDALYAEMYKALLSYEGKTDEEIFFTDYKEYESAGSMFSIGVVNVYDEAEAAAMAERMKAVMPSTLGSTGMDMAFAQINIYHDDISISYLVPSDDRASEVLKAAFEDLAEFDGTSYILKPGISRKSGLVPAVSNVLAAHPTE